MLKPNFNKKSEYLANKKFLSFNEKCSCKIRSNLDHIRIVQSATEFTSIIKKNLSPFKKS